MFDTMEAKNLTAYTVESDRDPEVYYEVRFFEDGHAECGCPAFAFSRTGICKHIERVKESGGGYKAPATAPAVKVFQFTHGDTTAVIADNTGSLETGIEEALKVLGVNKELVIKRIV